MDSSEQLAEVLSEFARTMLTDFPIQAILDRLVERIVDVLPVTAAGVTLISEGTDPRYVAASDADALTLERLQSSLGQGPCMQAYTSGEAVTVPDLRDDERFPEFVTSAAAVGVSAMFAFPLKHNDGRLGALDLYRDTTGPLEAWAMSAAQTLADVAASYLLNAKARQLSQETATVLRAAALHDPLTGLPNRVLLQMRLDHVAERASRSHLQAAVLFIDLDGFKAVNDRHGHQVGDALLVAVAGRLNALLRPGDTLARVSGDEFVVLCEDLNHASDVEAMAHRILEAFGSPYSVLPTQSGAGLRREIAITASVGIAFAGNADDMGAQLIHHADLAMYQVKRKGGNGSQVVDLVDAAVDADRVELVEDLRKAVHRGQLSMAYQPIVRPVDGLVIGAEALLRWTHPVRGPMPTLATVLMAEQHDLILELGEWVLERAMSDRLVWVRDHPGRPLGLAVNVSARQLMEPGLPELVARLLSGCEMEPSLLTLEMTESIFLDDNTQAMHALGRLKALGVRLALDDFGTGYSSLSYLRSYPVDVVKIDQSFVRDIGVAAGGGAIVAAVTSLAHVLGMEVVAEGVETERQLQEVVRFGCEAVQGHVYAPALSAWDFSSYLLAHPPVVAPPAGV